MTTINESFKQDTLAIALWAHPIWPQMMFLAGHRALDDSYARLRSDSWSIRKYLDKHLVNAKWPRVHQHAIAHVFVCQRKTFCQDAKAPLRCSRGATLDGAPHKTSVGLRRRRQGRKHTFRGWERQPRREPPWFTDVTMLWAEQWGTQKQSRSWFQKLGSQPLWILSKSMVSIKGSKGMEWFSDICYATLWHPHSLSPLNLSLSLSLFIYIYIYIYLSIYLSIYIYIYIHIHIKVRDQAGPRVRAAIRLPAPGSVGPVPSVAGSESYLPEVIRAWSGGSLLSARPGCRRAGSASGIERWSHECSSSSVHYSVQICRACLFTSALFCLLHGTVGWRWHGWDADGAIIFDTTRNVLDLGKTFEGKLWRACVEFQSYYNKLYKTAKQNEFQSYSEIERLSGQGLAR